MAEMTSRERVLAALDHRETDRIPIAMVCGGINPPAMQALDEFLQRNRGIDAQSYINSFLDVAEVWVTGDFNQELDMWGVARKAISFGAGSYSEIVHYPLREMETLQEIRQYTFPRVKDIPVDERVVEIKHLRKNGDQAIVLANANLFETSWYMRGFEQAFEDMMLQPDLIHFIMDMVTTFFTDYFYEILKRCREETRRLISVLGKNGGYLCGPSHFIQAGTPAENIVAYFDEAKEFYPFR